MILVQTKELLQFFCGGFFFIPNTQHCLPLGGEGGRRQAIG